MFITTPFWVFAIGALLFYYIIPSYCQNLWLLLASYFLYAYFDWRFLGLLVGATLFTWLIGLRLAPGSPHHRRYLAAGIGFNLLVLGFFKYLGFFSGPVLSALGRLGITLDPAFVTLALPLGVSFYTFRHLSYLFDVSAGRIPPTNAWLDVAVYVAFFPQIAAGPIERAARFLPRLKTPRHLSQSQLVEGVTYLLIGLFYKIVIADPLVVRTDQAFTAISQLSAPEAFIAMILYSIRLYADFAGYSAMAIGVSLWLGLPAMENFRQPYFAQSVVEFWARWHISLSSWFRDYVFFPLSRALVRRTGTQHAFTVQRFSLFVTMLLTGIWHGGTILFVIWGGLHGLYMVVERLLGEPRESETPPRWNRAVRVLGNILTTQLAVAVAWIFFRANTLSDAMLFFQRLFSADYRLDKSWLPMLVTAVVLFVGFDLLQLWAGKPMRYWDLALGWRVAVALAMLMAIIVFSGGPHSSFVYVWF